MQQKVEKPVINWRWRCLSVKVKIINYLENRRKEAGAASRINREAFIKLASRVDNAVPWGEGNYAKGNVCAFAAAHVIPYLTLRLPALFIVGIVSNGERTVKVICMPRAV